MNMICVFISILIKELQLLCECMRMYMCGMDNIYKRLLPLKNVLLLLDVICSPHWRYLIMIAGPVSYTHLDVYKRQV